MSKAYLVCQITPFEAQISANMLVNGPRKLIVELPSDKCKKYGSDCHHTRQSDKHRPDLLPEIILDLSP